MTDLETKIIQEFRSGRSLNADELSRKFEVPLPDIIAALHSIITDVHAEFAKRGVRPKVSFRLRVLPVRYALARWAARRVKRVSPWVVIPLAVFASAAVLGLVKNAILVGIVLTVALVVGDGIWRIWHRRKGAKRKLGLRA
jgi:hypothetical protein